ncbi:UNVERIFIED_CONTAM: hypothetical protein Slati_3888000 [Sesamum latifolium]|uniref:Uncharacterized protein n=1 Tax=Sesamum latifolium TaxID=2727402 RepID=A0AAW2TLX1_9LAMI
MDPLLGTHRPLHTTADKAYDDYIRDTVISRTNPVIPLRTTPVLSEPGTQVIPIKPPRLPYDDPRESVQSG